MHAMHNCTDQPARWGVQLHVRPVLRQAGDDDAARQSQSSGHAGSDSAVQTVTATRCDSWLSERAFLGTALSHDELVHGVRAGIISRYLFTS